MWQSWLNNRIYNTLLHKLSFLFTLLYVVIYFYGLLNSKLFFYLLISLILSAGVGGIGYLFNDYNDIEQDKQQGKQNIFNSISKTKIYILAIVLTAFTIIPWFFLPFTKISFCLILFEFILFYVYAFHPLRWKEKGLLGVFADAMYAHVIPSLLAIYTFSQFSNTPTFEASPLLITCLSLWLFLFGIRNIFIHQIEDLENDKKAKTKTLVQDIGEMKIKKIIFFCLVPAEFILFICLQCILPTPLWVITFTYVLFFIAYFIKKYFKNKFPFFMHESWKNKDVFYFFNGNMLNEYYEKFLPIVMILAFCLTNVEYGFLLVFHLIFFLPIYLKK
ncbi:MAG: UbiA family prenyltransferase [Bacteroidetes bacterium]|nr:UbiA family prenyltransferase [Bacteroidota bacterium]